MDFVLHCRSFLEVILYNTKAVVHFLLPDFFSCVCVYNIVQYLVLGEEIIFNFDNLIFLVISIRGWAFVLVRGMSILREKKKSPQERFPQFSPAPLFHTQLSFFYSLAAVAKSHAGSQVFQNTVNNSTASYWNQDTLRCQLNAHVVCGLRSAAPGKAAQNTWSCCLGHPVGSGLGSPFLLVFHE